MKKTIVYGFDLVPEVILRLSKENIIDVKFWITGRKHKITQVNAKTIEMHDLKFPWIKNTYIKEYDKFFDKNFLNFVEYYSRKRLLEFDLFEYQNIFNKYFYYLYDLLKDIDMILFSTIPHFGFDFLMYKMAKEIFNIKTVMFYPTLFPNKMWYLEDIKDYGEFNKLKYLNNKNQVDIKINKTFKKELFYMKNINKKSFKKSCFYKHLIKDFFNSLNVFDPYTNKNKLVPFNKYVKCKEYIKLSKNFANDIDLKQKFVYFPLHMQPELTSNVLAGKYSDQLLAIEKISKMIPDDWKIYVKENPKQTFYQRDKYFFERLKNIDKVVLVGKDVDTYELLEGCQFPATLTGTVGWEAISGGKAVLIFGQAWYKNLPGVIQYNDDLSIDDILNINIDHELLQKEVNKLISFCFDGIVDENYIKIYKDYDQSKNEDNIYKAIKKVLDE